MNAQTETFDELEKGFNKNYNVLGTIRGRKF